MRALGLQVMALLVFTSAPLRAEVHDRRAAAAHFQKGSALYADDHWSEALAEFEAGYESYPLRGFLVNIGQCHRKLERLDEAADAWQRFLATHPPDSKLRSEVEDALAEVEAARARSTTPPAVAATPSIPIGELTPVPAEPRADATPPALVSELSLPAPEKKQKRRAWVWAVVGVAIASVAAAVVTVGVVEWQASSPRGGSLGLIDGRR